MSQSRIEQLFSFLNDDPNDPFTIYAIALEYAKIDQAKSIEYFEKLLTEQPDYLATYYHAAQLYADMGMHKEAIVAYETGIAKASAQENSLALRELKNAYENFIFENEED